MAVKKMTRLIVKIAGNRRHINVPSGRANALHAFLRSKNVRSAPPEPAFTGFDNIELAPDNDVGSVQLLLDAWK